MPLRAPAVEIAKAFAELDEHTLASLKAFVARWYEPVGTELEALDFEDYGLPEDFLPNDTDAEVQQWAEHLCQLWQALTRQVECFCHQQIGIVPLSITIHVIYDL
jgi:hypothetical protein